MSNLLKETKKLTKESGCTPKHLQFPSALLLDLGIATVFEKNPVTFAFSGKELRFRIFDNPISSFDILELIHRRINFGCTVILFYSKRLTDKYIILHKNILKSYDRIYFYLKGNDPTLKNESYFLEAHDKLSFENKIRLVTKDIFGGTLICFSKHCVSLAVLDPVIFEWLIKNGIEIEYSAINSKFVFKVIKSFGLETVIWHYDGVNQESLEDNGFQLHGRAS